MFLGMHVGIISTTLICVIMLPHANLLKLQIILDIYISKVTKYMNLFSIVDAIWTNLKKVTIFCHVFLIHCNLHG